MNINEIIAAYIATEEQKKQAGKQADELKKLLLQAAGSAEIMKTDVYTVVVKHTAQNRIDTAALLKDFPDLKKDYGKTTISTSVSAFITAAATEKTA